MVAALNRALRDAHDILSNELGGLVEDDSPAIEKLLRDTDLEPHNDDLVLDETPRYITDESWKTQTKQQ